MRSRAVMKFSFLIFATTLILLNQALAASQARPGASHPPVTPPPTTPLPPGCPDPKNDAQVMAWRQGFLTSSVDTSTIPASIKSCFPTKIPSCLSRFSEYYGPAGVSDSYAAPDTVNTFSQYDLLQGQDYVNDPRRQLPKDLLVSGGGGDANYILRPDADAVARSKGWPVVKYKSRHSGGFDPTTSSLLMIEVPGASLTPPVTYDRFVNIAIPKDDVNDGTNPSPTKSIPTPDQLNSGAAYPTVTTQVTLDRANPKPKILFSFFQRQTGAAYVAQNMDTTLHYCYRCHDSGLRAISPLGYDVNAGEAQLSPTDWKTVKKLNDDMQKDMNVYPDWGQIMNSAGLVTDAINPDRYGPEVGASSPHTGAINTRSQAFIVGDGSAANPGCAAAQTQISVVDIFGRAPGANNIYNFSSSPPVDWNKVADAMDCQMCHNGTHKGVLSRATDWGTIQMKLLVDQSMPYGDHKNPMDLGSPTAAPTDRLNGNERIAVANCLQAEWAIQNQNVNVNDWLIENPCDDNAPTAKKTLKKSSMQKVYAAAMSKAQRVPSSTVKSKNKSKKKPAKKPVTTN